MKRIWLLSYVLLGACHAPLRTPSQGMADMPVAVSNNAVAAIGSGDALRLFSFTGLLAGKTHRDVTQAGWTWHRGRWQSLDAPDGVPPVLAAVAVSLGESVYLIGGYTVAADGSERSTPALHRLDPTDLSWHRVSDMPVPVDDAVALAYQDRYIYLISGWHDSDNVDAVQIFDTLTGDWHRGTAFPLPPVFGHAGGLVDDELLICDGVKVHIEADKKHFLPSPECVMGRIDADDFRQIDWRRVPHYSGVAHYRMGATGDALNARVVFAGGSDNPYNYNGIGYNGQASKPSGDVRAFDLQSGLWRVWPEHIQASMDHRGLLLNGAEFILLGGMRAGQQVSAAVQLFSLD